MVPLRSLDFLTFPVWFHLQVHSNSRVLWDDALTHVPYQIKSIHTNVILIITLVKWIIDFCIERYYESFESQRVYIDI